MMSMVVIHLELGMSGGVFLEVEGSVGSDVFVKKSLCGYARCRNAEKQNQ